MNGNKLNSVFLLAMTGAFVLLAICFANIASAGETLSRDELLAQAQLPEIISLPIPEGAISLPDDRDQGGAPVLIQLSKAPTGSLSVRRVSHNDGRLYLEICPAQGSLTTQAEVTCDGHQLGREQVNGAVWLSLKPKIGRINILVSAPGMAPAQLSSPTTLIEIRGRRIFLNDEPFLMKGVMAGSINDTEAAYIHSLGINTLRGLNAGPACERYGFMNIASLNYGGNTSKTTVKEADDVFEKTIGPSLDWLKENSVAPIGSPYTLILQLGNELTGGMTPPGVEPLAPARRHVSQMLANARNLMKTLAPDLPVGYANQDLTFLTPDCMDVYMHNSYLDKDRYSFPWSDFIKWQGCLPTNGPAGEGRPFVNSEFGANRYLCQSYLAGPNNPFLERIHAWNFPNRWAEFMEQGTVGGSIYCLCDLDTPHDQGCSRFGMLTDKHETKLACWQIGHMWRDFEVDVHGSELAVSYKRDYWARNCRLTVSTLNGQTVTRTLDDFAPHSARTLSPGAFALTNAVDGFRWSFDFTTHSGLTNGAAGAWPVAVEEKDFAERLKVRDTYPFLSQLFDAEVLTADGKPAPGTLSEMTNSDGLMPVALHKRNGVTYLLLISRDNPNTTSGPVLQGVTIDVAFRGKVERVDDMTGRPTGEPVDAIEIPGGLRLKNIEAARIPGAIGARSKTPFKLPIYRISPLMSAGL